MRQKICGIYSIKNTIENKIYIGSSKNIYSRWTIHKRELKNGTHHSKRLQEAYNQYGGESFVYEIIEKCDEDKLIELEQYYIDLYYSYNPDFGYNMSAIAGRPDLTEEQLKIIAKQNSERFKGENCYCNIYSENKYLI